jgi:hypothetical protein
VGLAEELVSMWKLMEWMARLLPLQLPAQAVFLAGY